MLCGTQNGYTLYVHMLCICTGLYALGQVYIIYHEITVINVYCKCAADRTKSSILACSYVYLTTFVACSVLGYTHFGNMSIKMRLKDHHTVYRQIFVFGVDLLVPQNAI